MRNSTVAEAPTYEIPILQAIAELDRKQSDQRCVPDGTRFTYSGTDFRSRVFELMSDELGAADFELVPRPERTTYAWLRLRTQLGQMVKNRKDVGRLLEIVYYGVAQKGRYRITDIGLRRLNYNAGTDFKISPEQPKGQ